MIATNLLLLLSGIGVFLVACHMMSSSLEAMGSNRLRSLFARVSKSKWLGVGIGAAGTAAIQSSGAISVMVIGFVNAGVMTLSQAATILFGANIGTTITGQIVAMGMFGGNTISTTVLFSAFAGVGAFLSSFAKKDRTKMTGEIIAGFGMLFVGLSTMSNAMENFARLESVKLFLAGIRNPILLILVGTILTAIIQSSSVMTSIAITMVVAGLISLDQGIYLTMGSNIGSCVVAMIAGMTGEKNARRTALIHLFFNIGGVVLFLGIGLLLHVFSGGDLSLGSLFARFFPDAPQTQLAMFHTVFNTLTVIVALPLTEQFVSLVTRLVPGEDPKDAGAAEEPPRLYYIDQNLLATPPIAVAQVKNEIVHMAGFAMENLRRAFRIITTLDFSEASAFDSMETKLDFLYHQIADFLARLSSQKLHARDSAYIATAFRTVSDIERIGDYAENIVEYASALRDAGESFSETEKQEIEAFLEEIETLFTQVMQAYTHHDMQALERADAIEEEIDAKTEELTGRLLDRLKKQETSPVSGTQYAALLSDAERVADHLINVVHTIREFPSQG